MEVPNDMMITLARIVDAAEDLAEMMVDTEYATSKHLDELIDSLVALEELNMTLAPPLEKTIGVPEWEVEENEDEEDD